MIQVLREDMEQIISDANIPWDRLRDSTVLVTGATGIICFALDKPPRRSGCARIYVYKRMIAAWRENEEANCKSDA